MAVVGTDKPHRIGLLTHSLQVGGAERVVASLANELATRPGVLVDVIIYGRSREVFYEMHPSVLLRQPPFAFDTSRRRTSTLRTLGFLRETFARQSYDALVSFGERWNNLVMLSSLGLREHVFLSDRSSPSLSLGPVQNTLRRALYPLATGLVAQTERAREQAARRHLNTNIHVLPNPVIAPAPTPDGRRDNILLSVGRLIRTKHHDRLIRMFATLADLGWELIIVGDDAQNQHHRERLEALVQRLGLSSSVHLVGAQRDVASYYARAKVFAFTSSSEGFPNVVAESLAAGLPVVAYDCDAGPADLIEDGINGFLVRQFDDDQFSARLRSLMIDDAQRMAFSAAARASVERLSIGSIASRLLSVVGADAPA